MPHVVVPDNVHQRALDVLNTAEGLTVNAPGLMTREQLLSAVNDADGLVIRSGHKIDAEIITSAPNLKAIARAGVGVDNVDLALATERGIVVMNTPDGNTISTAEHAFGLMLSLARHIPEAYQSMREGKWDRKSFSGVELRNKVLGLVGFGRIGQAIAKRAQAFDMDVVAFDPYISTEVATAMNVQLVSLNDVYARADFISLHAVLNDETRNLFNAETLAQLKPGVRIINAARGALIDEHALAEAVKSGHVAGAALDVYQQEPPEPNNPLIGLSGIIHTPHLAASTEDAQIVVSVDAAKLIVDALLRGKYINVVNPAALT